MIANGTFAHISAPAVLWLEEQGCAAPSTDGLTPSTPPLTLKAPTGMLHGVSAYGMDTDEPPFPA
jgi:hypothetical protein